MALSQAHVLGKSPKIGLKFYSERKIFYYELLKRKFFHSKKAIWQNRYTT